jgi:uncharacterized protein (TIGR03067 family)
MFRKWSILFAFGVLTGTGTLLLAEEQQTGADVLKQIQGTWKFTKMDVDGKAMSAAEVAKRNITFTGDKWVVREDGKSVQEGTHKFDPAKKPGQLDAIVTEGQDKGSTMIGIYELTGDTMRVCFDTQGKDRPTSFNATKAGQMAATVQREKK